MQQRSARAITFERDGRRCVVCGRSEALSIHHIKPRALGGRNHSSNLVTLCRPCHEAIEDGIKRALAWVIPTAVWLCCGPVLHLARITAPLRRHTSRATQRAADT